MTKQNLFCLYMGAEPLEVEFKDGTNRKVVGISIYEDMIQVLDNDGNTDWWNISPDCTALLYDLSDITDEDAVEVAKMAVYSGGDIKLASIGKEIVKNLIGNSGRVYHYPNVIDIIDYLRLHHYCTNEAYWKNGWAKRRVRG